MVYDFSYVAEKIKSARFLTNPFSHIYIENIFSHEHFEEITNSSEIASPAAVNDRQLIKSLYEKGYKVISFPGCITDIEEYLSWHSGDKDGDYHSACEGFGMTLRLYNHQAPILKALDEFLSSDYFNRVIAEKFDIKLGDCTYDGGIQKYLDGYEISPHPDIRKKAATFMVNINPNEHSESANHHTHYLKFKAEREYVKTFWEGNPLLDRAWVPWEWTQTIYQQNKNNSIVLFSPSNETMHGVKANYDHLITQRTQLYGNLWYDNVQSLERLEWEDLDLHSRLITKQPPNNLKKIAKNLLPNRVISSIKHLRKPRVVSPSKDVGKRNL